MYNLLSHLEGITLKLQNRAIDILDAYSLIDSIKDVYDDIRKKLDSGVFRQIYTQAIRMADAVGTSPSQPRVTGRQQHCSNVPSQTTEDHYLQNLVIPFVDHIQNHLDSQFMGASAAASSLPGLVPSVVVNRDVDFSAAVELHKKDLPSPQLFEQEILRWKVKWAKESKKNLPGSRGM